MAELERLGLRLVPAFDADPVALLSFERDNRAFFRSWVGDRGDGYYDLASVTESLAAARRRWDAGSDRMHVVTATTGAIVARVNLVDIVAGRGHLGYRVAEAHGGRGIATAAVGCVLRRAPEWGVDEVRAVTRCDNLASGRVLERCGFVRGGTRKVLLEPGRPADAIIDWSVTPST